MHKRPPKRRATENCLVVLLSYRSALLCLGFLAWLYQPSVDGAEESRRALQCLAVDSFFADEVWAKVGERNCLKCHKANGEAADSDFLLQETQAERTAISRNCLAFSRMATAETDGKTRLLEKATGGLDHGGGEVLKTDSTEYRILSRFVGRLNRGHTKTPEREVPPGDYDAPPFFDGVQMISNERLLRRVTLSLAGRLPSEQESAAVKDRGLSVMDGLLDQLLKEDAFYERLKEGFNDIFLTSFPANGEELLSWAHFPNRLWYQKHDLSTVDNGETGERARWKLAAVYRESIKREPLELIEHIVRNNRPFTELVTADYIMVSPYSSRGYGVFEEVREQFKDSGDPFEYVPVRLKALKNRKGKTVQESATGFYPHAGFLSMFHYLRRYPTTETNRNRLRARMYYQHFLGIDVMALAPRVTDAAAVLEEYDVPTMQAADCVICHRTVDPVAGLFQDFNEEGHLGPRKDGWYTDMFGPGLEGQELPKGDRWRALQWLGKRTAKDPRFAVAMVEHVYYILAGRKVLERPEDIEDPMFLSKRRAYQEQRELIEEVAKQFTESEFNLKIVFKALALSDFYRADGLATIAQHPRRMGELEEVGLVHLLTPEQLERKIKAIFGQRWGRLDSPDSKFKILYGGIDSHSVTERMTEPSGAMGSIQRVMANDVACKNVALDFTKERSQRRLFPNIELTVVPSDGVEAQKQIRQSIVYLYQLLHGRQHSIDHQAVDRTYKLFAGIIRDAEAAKFDRHGSYFCERVNKEWVDDAHYTLRAWRGVVTYLLRQYDFLYE